MPPELFNDRMRTRLRVERMVRGMAFVEDVTVTLDADARVTGHIDVPRSRLSLVARVVATEDVELITTVSTTRIRADGGKSPSTTATLAPRE